MVESKIIYFLCFAIDAIIAVGCFVDAVQLGALQLELHLLISIGLSSTTGFLFAVQALYYVFAGIVSYTTEIDLLLNSR